MVPFFKGYALTMKISEIAVGFSKRISIVSAIKVLRSGTLENLRGEGGPVEFVSAVSKPTNIRHFDTMIIHAAEEPCCPEDERYFSDGVLSSKLIDELCDLASLKHLGCEVKKSLNEECGAAAGGDGAGSAGSTGGATSAADVGTLVHPLGSRKKKQILLRR